VQSPLRPKLQPVAQWRNQEPPNANLLLITTTEDKEHLTLALEAEAPRMDAVKTPKLHREEQDQDLLVTDKTKTNSPTKISGPVPLRKRTDNQLRADQAPDDPTDGKPRISF
jgi:hypothetical protein